MGILILWFLVGKVVMILSYVDMFETGFVCRVLVLVIVLLLLTLEVIWMLYTISMTTLVGGHVF
jgi:hypothetical protein